MRPPFSPLHLLIFVFVLALLLAFIQVGVITIAFDKLGLTVQSGMLLLFTSLAGSMINLPLFSLKAQTPPHAPPTGLMLPRAALGRPDRVMVAVNVGGGLVPILFSVYLVANNQLPLGPAAVAIVLVSAISHLVSRPVHGLGIAMPIFVAPISAALVAILLLPEQSAPLAYVCGTLGVLIGADLLRIRDVPRLGAPVASIGGAGTFDGIFITGIVAVLLA